MCDKKKFDPNDLFEDDDVDNAIPVNSFRSRKPPPQPTPNKGYGGHIAELGRQQQTTLEKQCAIEQDAIVSTARSLSMLRETKNIGIKTARELSHQREQLENTNKILDDINTNLNKSQKHINSIKSVFCSFKTYVFGKVDQTYLKSQAAPSSFSAGASNSRLNDTLNKIPRHGDKNTFNFHSTKCLFELDESNDGKVVTNTQCVNDILEANLNEMVHEISQLKDLGVAFGEEIKIQNGLIDIIQDKVEVSDIKICKQNKQINNLLGK